MQAGLSRQVPDLRTLVLTGNAVQELADLDVLGGCGKLVHVSLVDNPVASKEVCHDCPRPDAGMQY